MSKEDKIPQEEMLKKNLGKIAYTLDKEYFSRLNEDYYVLPYDEYYNVEEVQLENGKKKKVEINTYASNVRALKIKRLVYNKEECFNDCLQNALSVFSDSGNTLALVFNRFSDRTEVYAVVRNDGQGKNEESKANIYLLKDSLAGNFAGSELEVIDEKHGGNDTKRIFFDGDECLVDKIESIAGVCNIPSAKSAEYISQNIEKLLNGIVPQKKDEWYSVIIFAESLTTETIHSMRDGLEEMATGIFPFKQHQFQIGENKAESIGEMKSLSHSDSTSEAITKIHSINVGINGSRFSSQSIGLASKAFSLGVSEGISLGYGYSWGKTTTKGETDTRTTGTNNSITLGESDSTTYSFQSYTVKNILERIEKSLDRLRIGEAVGYWKYAAYVCSSSPKVSRNVTNYLRSLTQGAESFVEPATIKEWYKETGNGDTDFDQIKKYILNFSHPVFVNNVDGMLVNFSANINTSELANVMVLPQHSIQGIPVIAGVSFGREAHSISDITLDLPLGCGYHMFKKQESQIIRISKEELTKHTFITGSTGAGKSNTVYKMLDELMQRDVHFLVIEPAKGEYRNVFGERKNVVVYSSNPKMIGTELLRINPFRFPDNVHVLEHIDRLVEIFNVCWPMYAAMPAILKDSIVRAYSAAGWDLITSENAYDKELYPTFADVAKQIRDVLNESDYSADNKGDYTGSLVTRLRSLTNGINGLIFAADDIPDAELFDQNAIVDLSRIGSTETKALIMGVLILKLQEHRMGQAAPNSSLRHVTVLEEAHNLLRKTSIEQSSEGANLLGKSVEMLSNSIAEMRTYGEGFIIADQSPGLLDLSVIRNTNTKIIMRLPDLSDRELVGKAAGLNDDQIIELSRLEAGVASIIQSGWIEPVLCKIDEYKKEAACNQGERTKRSLPLNFNVEKSLLGCIMSREIYRKGDRVDIFKLRNAVIKSSLSAEVKCDFMRYIGSDSEENVRQLQSLVYDFFDASNAIGTSQKYDDIRLWAKSVADKLKPTIKGFSNQQINLLLALIVNEQVVRAAEYNDLYCKFTEMYRREGRVY